MYSIPEEEYMIDGIKSWIHCILLHHDPSPKSAPMIYHYHDYIELLYSLSTNATVWLEGECYNFEPGDFIVINSGELHVVVPEECSEYICVKFSPQVLYTAEQALLEYKYVIPFLAGSTHPKKFTAKEIEGTLIPALCLDTMKEWNEQRTAYEISIRSNILKIFTEIFRLKYNNVLLPNLKLNNALKTAIAYIHENFSTITEKEVAKNSGLSYHYFSSAFKAATGQSFNAYLNAVKLREAEKQLILSDKTITEIAYETGFANASHLISHFKEYKHTTPSQFRRKMRKQST